MHEIMWSNLPVNYSWKRGQRWEVLLGHCTHRLQRAPVVPLKLGVSTPSLVGTLCRCATVDGKATIVPFRNVITNLKPLLRVS